jgi:hypothetical protein
MKTLQDATLKICELKGNVLALESFIAALVQVLPHDALRRLQEEFSRETEVGRTVLLNASISEHTLAAYDHDAQRLTSRIQDRLR